MIWTHVMLAVSNVDYVPIHVLDRAGRIARGLQARVELFAAIYEPDLVQPGRHSEPVDTIIAGRIEDCQRRLERQADILREQGVTVQCTVRWDYPVYEAVIRHVQRHNVNLLIVPAISTNDVGPRTLHYREARLIEECPCPVLLLKSREVYSKGCIVAAVDPLHAQAKPDELDDNVVLAAKTLSYALAEEPVHLYHADTPVTDTVTGLVAAGCGAETEEQRALRLKVHERVRGMAGHHNIQSPNVHFEWGAVERTLPGFALRKNADVVVMGALSRAYSQRAVLAHKAEQVLDAIGCDVLVVKPRGFASGVPHEPAPAVVAAGLEHRP